MITSPLAPNGHAGPATPGPALTGNPDWPWGNPLTGDPLLRADDKAFHDLRGRPEALAAMVTTIRDARTRAEIRLRAQRRCHDLEQQLDDVHQRHLTDLEPEAALELAHQRSYLDLISRGD